MGGRALETLHVFLNSHHFLMALYSSSSCDLWRFADDDGSVLLVMMLASMSLVWGLLQNIAPNPYVHDKLILINCPFLGSCSTSVPVLFLIVHFVVMEARTSKIYYRKKGFAPFCCQQLHAHHRCIDVTKLSFQHTFASSRTGHSLVNACHKNTLKTARC